VQKQAVCHGSGQKILDKAGYEQPIASLPQRKSVAIAFNNDISLR